MISTTHALMIVAMMAVVTAAIRFAPFLLFQKKTPKVILYLGEVLPYAVMPMLIVYCLKGVHLLKGSHGLPEAVGVFVVAIVHKWKHNTLLSILTGTICYMILVQWVFV